MIIQGLVGVEKDLCKYLSYKKDLLFKIKDFFSDRTVEVELWEESDSFIYLPRFYVRMYLDLTGASNRTSYVPVKIPFKWELDNHIKKDLQNVIVDNILADFRAKAQQFEGGLVTVPMGSGKTVIALKLASKLGVKTLVIAHREILFGQWRKMINTFCGLPYESIGMVQGSEWVYDKPITVAMLQTLLSDRMPEDFKTSFGLVIVDEVTHIAAPVWWQIAKRLWSRFTLGLTGTPKKAQDLHKMFKYTIGFKEYGSEELKLRGQVDVYDYTFYMPDFHKCIRNDQLFVPLFISRIVKNKSYLRFIIGVIKKYMENNRYILVVTDRVNHAKIMLEILQRMYPNRKCQLLVGGVKEVEYASCYVGTAQYIAEGVDIPHLDTIVFTTPRYNIQQLVGRLFRNLNNKHIIVVDIRHKVFPSAQFLDELYNVRYRKYVGWGLDVYFKS